MILERNLLSDIRKEKRYITIEITSKMRREYYAHWYNAFENIIKAIFSLKKYTYKISTPEKNGKPK